MARGGKRTNAGRKAGSRTKKTQQFLEAVKAGGETPLDYALRVMRDKTVDHARRDEMCKAALPYTHSKLPTAIITPPPPSGPIEENDEHLLDLYLNGLHDEADES
jgi:hypothetical protein